MEDADKPRISASGEIFSLRLVTVDHYMHYPVAELDPCYSDYRGSVISKVPVIRIFGTDGDGTKTCAHIHGIFPYLYIPYDSRSANEEADRFSYQLASSLDKALNISLGQSSSDTEHIFKIVHVKGIPFYGYHPKAHQFLKIYLYNPGLIRRVGSLLQSGAILGRVFQAHETHVPFVLQFMIDYNLYGMSSLHCPADHLRYRRSPNDHIPDGRHHQIHTKLERTATSKQECDISAAYILNRLEINTNAAASQQSHANPGIATIWKDERVRRDRMSGAENDPPPVLEVPLPEQRPHAEIADSEVFHLDVLRSKLERIITSAGTDNSTLLSDATLNETGMSATLTHNNISSVDKQQPNRSKFNLKRLLANSVYPAECSQQSSLLDASYIVDHQPGRAGRPRRSQRHATQEAVNGGDMTLNEDEFQLLNVMKLLEDDQQTAPIDGDSILAPLSQAKTSQQGRSQPTKGTDVNDNAPPADVDWDDSDFDPDDNLLNDFSICIDPDEHSAQPDNIKAAIKLTAASGQYDADDQTLATMRIPQLDGVSDADSPRRTPRSKYAPLNVTVHTNTPLGSMAKRRISMSPAGQTPKRSRLEMLSQLACIDDAPPIDLTLSDDEAPNGTDVTFVDCRLRAARSKNPNPMRTEPHRVLRTVRIPEGPDKHPSSPSQQPECTDIEPSDEPPADHVQIMQHLPFVRLLKYSDIERAFDPKTPLLATPPEPTVRRSLRSHTSKPSPSTGDVPTDRKLRSKRTTVAKNQPPTLDELYANINCEVSRRYDERHNFFPEPGPSTVNYYENVDIPGYYGPVAAATTTDTTAFVTPNAPVGGPKRGRKRKVPDGPAIVGNCVLVPLLRSPTFDEVLSQMPVYGIPYSCENDTIDDEQVEEFCSDVLATGSGLNARKRSSPTQTKRATTPSKPITSNGVRRAVAAAKTIAAPRPKDDSTVLMPLLRAPTYDEVLASMPDYDIPYCFEEEPFYSNAADATARKEVGHTLLVIPTRTLDDLPPFDSSVLEPNLGIAARKHEVELKLIGIETGGTKRPTAINSKQVRTLFATDEPCVLRTVYEAPSPADAKQWVKINMRGMPDGDPLDDPLHIPAVKPFRRQAAQINGAEDPLALPTDPLCFSPASSRTSRSVRQTPSGGSISPGIIEGSPSADIDPRMTSLRRRSRALLERSATVTKPSDRSSSVSSPEPHVKSLRSALDRIRRGNAASPSLFGSASPTPSAVICLDDDGDEDEAVANGVTQLFGDARATVKSNGHAKAAAVANRVLDVQESLVADHSFGITGATLENTFGFKMDLENLQTANAHSDFNYLTIMSLEVHVPTRGNLRPDPAHDAIVCLLYNIQNNVPDRHGQAEALGVIVQTDGEPDGDQHRAGLRRLAKAAHPTLPIDVTCVRTEHDLLQHLLALVAHWDPDIFAGYEIEMASWGYVLQRAQHMGINMKMHLSRVPTPGAAAARQTDGDEEAAAQAQAGFYGTEYVEFEVRLAGRIFLDVWRLMRSEMALTSYTFENVMYHVLHRRCPHYGFRELTRLWRRPAALKEATNGGGANVTHRWTVLEYYVERVVGSLELLNQLDLIGRTCELAKLFGIQFFEVLSRGSQFRVESMMLRMAKPKNIIPVSPSVQQRAHMRAPEYLPLILEPLSRLYTDSLIVLDFQSLYPSVIIAYNYCFSTCLGRVEHLGQSEPFEFGASQLRVSRQLLRKLLDRDLVTVSPCGVVFVKAAVREGVLPRMLREILDTRLMVKQSMKLHRDDRLLQRVLHSRQLGLKLMANVTYGYTAANFSGRMPCVEIADSVVSKGRETLERAIKTVSTNTKRWRSRVIYGDTDSLFVLVPGRTREDAFRIGTEIVDAVTQANPHPIKLKLEKIYQPSILQTKKRYVGYMYETPDQKLPVYEAKGIETVRRDGCPAVAKMLEKTLKTLFETRDVSAVKRYVCRQFTKIMGGRANLQDFTFAKEFRGVQGYKPGACVPSLELTRRWMQLDGRAEPRRGERVPYVIVNGAPGVPLIRLVRSPLEFMADEGMTINSVYYITKVIVPALNRCLLLIGADAFHWYAELPRPQLASSNTVRAKEMALMGAPPATLKMSTAGGGGGGGVAKKSTIAQYFATTGCPTDCGAQTKDDLCAECRRRPQTTAVILSAKMAATDRRLGLLQRTCASCCAGPLANGTQAVRCESLDCPVLHVLCNARREHAQVAYWREIMAKYCE